MDGDGDEPGAQISCAGAAAACGRTLRVLVSQLFGALAGIARYHAISRTFEQAGQDLQADLRPADQPRAGCGEAVHVTRCIKFMSSACCRMRPIFRSIPKAPPARGAIRRNRRRRRRPSHDTIPGAGSPLASRGNSMRSLWICLAATMLAQRPPGPFRSFRRRHPSMKRRSTVRLRMSERCSTSNRRSASACWGA